MMDWLAREGWILAVWWGLVTLAGAAVWPLLWRVLASLPDRGYLLSRAAGVLLVAVVYWLLGTFGFVRADVGGVTVAWLVVLGVSVVALRQLPDLAGTRLSLGQWWRDHRTAVIIAEVLFIALIVGWGAYRAYQNNLASTEKPMDLAFTASVWRGESFPPADPWLSGYAISYYYLGYVMAGTLSKLSGVYPALGYNAWTAMLAALAGLTAFGVVYNLVKARQAETLRAAGFALVGAVMLVLMGNYQTALVDVPYYSGTASQEYLSFWDVGERQTPRYAPGFTPENTTWDYWWWFRSARVIHDRNFESLGGDANTVINEFPAFSYVLGDNHPHVMALPFFLLALGVGLSVALNRRTPTLLHTVFYSATAGSLIFMNTWDAPAALGLIIAAEALRRRHASGGKLGAEDAWYIAAFALALVGMAVVIYWPFLISFSSQLGGALPNFWHPTRFTQILLTFGALVPLTALFLAVEAWRGRRAMNWRAGFITGGVVLGVVLLAFSALTILGMVFPVMQGPDQASLIANPDLIGETLARRISPNYLLTTVLLVVGAVVAGARLFGHGGKPTTDDEKLKMDGVPVSLSSGFALLMVGAALLLVLAPEWVYLRDVFSDRMNTVFKFYYQAWALLAVASAYGLYVTFSDDSYGRGVRLPVRVALAPLVVICIGIGMVYLAYAIPARALDETGRTGGATPLITLDGSSSLSAPDDYAALVCLRELTVGRTDLVVAETTGGGYDSYPGGIASGRVTGVTGLTTVLGWQGHQSQWRGVGYPAAVGTRVQDLETLYGDLRLDIAARIIDRYGIDYIVYGPAERERYGAGGELKFIESLEVVCEVGATRVFRTAGVSRVFTE